ncbi:hypothetical protein CEUSTIGMA_g5972.t1 [Chlamydomonas eustigma]|uniref:Phospholipid/glycerol acyltransferase domain-containing protein n=1 Tax=Chlamydomonas eustigma TaxID=1157962 RepID=A0A250X6M5_9CHLO|nr:hypothetical protein CEUSTIGMA_g5972.t1 [Chlamydomonas eustigma]|eukprot:GAX78532.1 hypothetical protein CEUSTIGMA_g5972.t1 [Chlamydomonas eustigma]
MSIPTLLSIPYFAACVFVFYWSNTLGCLCYKIKFMNLIGPRKDMHDWSEFMNWFFGVQYRQVGEQSLHKGERCLYLSNHRSWADFFVDIYLTEGMAAPMSRNLVFYVFPFFMTSVSILKGIILFKRGVIEDKQKFNAWLDSKLDSSIRPSLLVYPEGHRSTRASSLPLKRGMLHYAHSRKLPIQIIMTKGKEGVLSEKHMRASYGVTLATGFSEVIKSSNFPEFEAFALKVQQVWDAKWQEVYTADISRRPDC